MLSLNLLWVLPASAALSLLVFGVMYPIIDGRHRRMREAERRAKHWESLAKNFQRVADARMAELHELHDEMDRALIEDHIVALLEEIPVPGEWDIP